MDHDQKPPLAFEQGYQLQPALSLPPPVPSLIPSHDTTQNGSQRNTRVEPQLPIPYNADSPNPVLIGTKPLLGGFAGTGASNFYNALPFQGQGSYGINTNGSEFSAAAQTGANSTAQPSLSGNNGTLTKQGNNPDLASSDMGPRRTNSSFSLNNPEKTRRRVPKACDRCRAHKVKCTGVHPCYNCTKHGVECRYNLRPPNEELSVKRRKTDPDRSPLPLTEYESGPETSSLNILSSRTQLPAIKADIELLAPSIGSSDHQSVRLLENRIAYLEQLLQEKVEKSAMGMPDTEFIPKLAYFEAERKELEAEEDKSRSEENPSIIDLFQSCTSKRRVCTKPSVFLTMLLCGNLYKSLSESSQAKVECPRTQYYGWNLSGCHYLRPETIPPFPEMPDFSEKRKEGLVNYFFREINPLYAILHESVFREQLHVFLSLQSEPLQQGNRTALFLAMLALVYTLSIRFEEFLKATGPLMDSLQIEESLFKYAFRVALIFSLEWESYEIIQCWLLATLYLRISHKQCSFSNTLSQGLNMVRLMGLGRRDVRLDKPQTYENLKAKRIFFSAFCFDRTMGLQSGKFLFFNSNDVKRTFPLYDFEQQIENDEWITLPSLAMIHISRLTFYIELFDPSDRNAKNLAMIEQDLVRLGTWLDINGFSEEAIQKAAYILSSGIEEEVHSRLMSATIRAQVKLYYCDLVMCIYGKLMFQFVSTDIVSSTPAKFSILLNAMESSLNTVKILDRAHQLYSPWYMTLATLISTGVYAAVFLSIGKFEAESRVILKDSINLMARLKDSAVYDRNGALVFRERFKMVGECMWVLKLVNHMMALKHEDALKSCEDIGIDHGPSDVNRHTFELLGVRGEKRLALDELVERQDSRTTKAGVEDVSLNEAKYKVDADKDKDTFQDLEDEFRNTAQPDSTDFGMDDLLGNLQWFDQWLGT